MARIRSLHPGQWTDVDFVSCSPMARLLALALRNEADDNGVFEWKPLQLKMKIFPADNIEITELLDELLASNQVKKFPSSSKEYGAIRNFRRWQRPEKPKSVHPIDDNTRDYVGLSTKAGPPDDDGRRQGASQSPSIGDQAATDGSGENHSRRPVDDQSAKVISEEGGRRKDEGGRRGGAGGEGGALPRANPHEKKLDRLSKLLDPLKRAELEDLSQKIEVVHG